MQLDAILTEREYLDGRSSRRRALRLSVGVHGQNGSWTSVVIHNIANGGLLLESEMVVLEIGESITVELPEKRVVQAEVAWANAPFFGCRTGGNLSSAEIAAALLKSEPVNGAPVHSAVETGRKLWSRNGAKFVPELNFSVAFGLSMMLWILIALVIYLIY